MAVSKAWNWGKERSPIWLEPCEESYYLAARWIGMGCETLLDLGCGLGRHAIHFARQGVPGVGVRPVGGGTAHLRDWAGREGLDIDVKTADMRRLPYPDGAFDCVFAFHVISHTDTAGLRAVLSEIGRVLKKGGEVFLTLCSKETWSFREAGYPRLDGNTVVKTGGGPEDGVPHVFVELDEIPELLRASPSSGSAIPTIAGSTDAGKAANTISFWPGVRYNGYRPILPKCEG